MEWEGNITKRGKEVIKYIEKSIILQEYSSEREIKDKRRKGGRGRKRKEQQEK